MSFLPEAEQSDGRKPDPEQPETFWSQTEKAEGAKGHAQKLLSKPKQLFLNLRNLN